MVMFDFGHFDVLTFDCYGTLIDWESGILDAIRPVLARYGVERNDREILETYADLEAKKETGAYVPYRRVLEGVMTELSRDWRFEASADELNCISESIKDWRPFPDTVGALRTIRRTRKLAVISNIDDALFEASARRLATPFDWVVTAQQAEAYKPSPRTFELALDTIGLPRERILHVAQSVYHDIIPAGKLGLATVWVNRRAGEPGTGATKAATAEPDLEVPDLRSLADMIGSNG
jgi:2-haloacid dehalogenase